MKRLIRKNLRYNQKKLIKQSIMNLEMFKGTLDQLGQQGREILKEIEEYKFKLEQAARIVTNDQILTQKLIQKQKQLDAASGQIYSIVFDVENIDITQAYEQQQIMTNPNMNQGGPGEPDIVGPGAPKPMTPPSTFNQPPMQSPMAPSPMGGGDDSEGPASAGPTDDSEGDIEVEDTADEEAPEE